MTTKISVLICLIIVCTVSASASEDVPLNHCTVGSAPKRGMLAQAWRDLSSSLELSNPTEAQRLVALRLDLVSLVAKKETLVSTVKDVVQQASVPSWLQARVEQIPVVQNEILRLMSSIQDEARRGGLLAASPSLAALIKVLDTKRLVTLCELATIPVPLPKAQAPKVTILLQDIQEEIQALGELDKTLAKLIEDANKAH